VSRIFARLKESIDRLERAVSGEIAHATEAQILAQRTERIARQPEQVEPAPGEFACLVFERNSGRYAARLESLQDVGLMGPIARVPAIPEVYLGVTARRGKVVAVADLPRLFGAVSAEHEPSWLIMTGDLACGIAADALHDIIEIDARKMTRTMPTFPPLVQKYTLGVLEDRTVVLDVAGLLSDRALRVEHRT
jgi:chemotaxis signal transduction protein